ncbi:MAG: tetratricopeptide repeat protein [Desulfobacteraceae bacterium]
MLEKGKALIEIDLNRFKIHIRKEDRTELSLHFDSPSRRFYLSVIALVVNEMKNLGKVTSIPLESHYDTLALLNETVGGRAGSSDRKNLLRRIYRKWKDALPDLEHAPLFTIPGRRKEYGDTIGKTYAFTDEEKDAWANLFEYKGSLENVRLRFSIDRLGATLDQVAITYGKEPDLSNEYSWDRFMGSLKREAYDHDVKEEVALTAVPGKRARWHRWSLGGMVGLLLVGVIVAIQYFSFHKPKLASDGFLSVESPLPLPDKPSIAVLPFVNMSGDPEQEYFCDGLTDTIITALSIIPDMFVIARNSSFTYKGKPVKVQQVSEELGVRYVLEGGFHKSGDRVRITVQLLDALTGKHVWAERYEQDVKETFALQDELTVKVVNAMQVKLTEGEQARLQGIETPPLDLYLKEWQAVGYLLRFTKEGNIRARQLLEEYIALVPDSPVGWTNLAEVCLWDIWLGLSKSPRASVAQAEKMARKAIDLGTTLPLPHITLSRVYLMQRKHEKAIAEAELALALAPNWDRAYGMLGANLNWAGRHEEAIPVLKRTLRLDPFPRHHIYSQLCIAYRCLGRYEEAVAACEKAVQLAPDSALRHASMAATYSLAGREEEARAAAAEVLRIDPKFSLEYLAKIAPYKNQADLEKFINPLRKVGLK